MWLLLSVLLIGNLGFSQATCPNLEGIYAEDDFRVTIKQDGCDVLQLKGYKALSYYDLKDLKADAEETICSRSKAATWYCLTRWENDELIVNIRRVVSGKESSETLKILRCDYSSDSDCKYGTVKPEDTIQLTLRWISALLPRRES